MRGNGQAFKPDTENSFVISVISARHAIALRRRVVKNQAGFVFFPHSKRFHGNELRIL
jgi:hypothetical protein